MNEFFRKKSAVPFNSLPNLVISQPLWVTKLSFKHNPTLVDGFHSVCLCKLVIRQKIDIPRRVPRVMDNFRSNTSASVPDSLERLLTSIASSQDTIFESFRLPPKINSAGVTPRSWQMNKVCWQRKRWHQTLLVLYNLRTHQDILVTVYCINPVEWWSRDSPGLAHYYVANSFSHPSKRRLATHFLDTKVDSFHCGRTCY